MLCDPLAEADREQPDLLIDCATLTGAARVALGPELPALFTRRRRARRRAAGGRRRRRSIRSGACRCTGPIARCSTARSPTSTTPAPAASPARSRRRCSCSEFVDRDQVLGASRHLRLEPEGPAGPAQGRRGDRPARPARPDRRAASQPEPLPIRARRSPWTATSPRAPTIACFYEVPTRWLDNDVYGHVNNVNYYSYFDTAIAHYLMREGGLDPWRDRGDRLLRRERLPVPPGRALPRPHHGRPQGDPASAAPASRYAIGIFRNDDERDGGRRPLRPRLRRARERAPGADPDRLRAALGAAARSMPVESLAISLRPRLACKASIASLDNPLRRWRRAGRNRERAAGATADQPVSTRVRGRGQRELRRRLRRALRRLARPPRRAGRERAGRRLRRRSSAAQRRGAAHRRRTASASCCTSCRARRATSIACWPPATSPTCAAPTSRSAPARPTRS